MAATYTPIASATLAASTSSITFSSIPATYTDIVVVINDINSTGSFDTNIRFNGDSGSNYSRTGLRGDIAESLRPFVINTPQTPYRIFG